MKKSVKIILIILIVFLVGVVVCGYFYVKSPKNVFKSFLKQVYNYKDEYNKNIKLDMDFSINGDIGDEYKSYSELFRDVSVGVVLNSDLDNDRFLLVGDVDYKGSSILNTNVYYENDEFYVELVDLFDSVIKIDSAEYIKKEDINVVIDTIYDGLNEVLSIGKYTSGKEVIDDKEVDKYTFIIDNNNKDKIVNRFINVLKDSNDFINIINKLGIDINEIKVDELDSEVNIILYTSNNKFVKLSIYEGEKEIGYINPTEKNTKIKMYSDELKLMMIVSKHKGNSFSVTSNIYTKDISLNIGINGSYTFDEEIDKLDIDNAIKLSEDDKEKIEEDFNNSNGVIEFKKDAKNIKNESDNSTESDINDFKED